MLDQMCLIVNQTINIKHVIDPFCAVSVFLNDQREWSSNHLHEVKHQDGGGVTDCLLGQMSEEYLI